MKALNIDQTILSRRSEIVAALRMIIAGEGVIETEISRRPYERRRLTAYANLPMVVVLPSTVDELRAVLAYCYAHDVKVVPRGAGTSLSGGSLPLQDGVLISMMKFNKIKETDFENRLAVVEPGVTNSAITPRGRTSRLLLCAGPFLADRLLDRRQCGRKLRRRALPKIWAHHQ